MELLLAGARELGIALTVAQVEAFRIYQVELLEWNARFNLTAITDDTGVQVRHFLDSLSCLPALETEERLGSLSVLDVGAGAGFPGLPLKIARPGLRLTLLEATGKKTRFLEHIVRRLGLERVTVLQGRAEELGQDPQYRERYDLVLARAVAEMPTLAEYLLPLARLGGRVAVQKGENAPAELQSAAYAIQLLGGQLRRLVPITLRGLAETRYLALLDKVAATPPHYPRRVGVPTKRPLLVQ